MSTQRFLDWLYRHWGGLCFSERKQSICLKDFPSRYTVAFKITQVLVFAWPFSPPWVQQWKSTHITVAISWVQSPTGTGGWTAWQSQGLPQIYSCAFIYGAMSNECFKRGLLNTARGREGVFPMTGRGHRERVFHLSATATNMPAHLFTLSLVPASSANSYRNILAGGSLFSFFTKDLSVCVPVCVCTCVCVFV